MPLLQKLSILIVDADLLGREALKRLLREEYRNLHLGEAGTAEEALNLIRSHHWRLLILDASLPDNDGFAVLQEARRQCPGTAVLMRSIYADSVHGVRSRQLGAAGYLSKGCGRPILLKAFGRVLSGKNYFSQSVSRTACQAPVPQANLSAQELKVFLALAVGRRLVEVASELGLSAKTVSTYKRRVLNKLDLKSTADIVRYQIDHNLQAV
jgi:DNA-binding NarL/FixJ family response regulator